ncbi:MAG TPA: DUF1080 domain-containing protein [Tepidisphaeraceae bacterium]|jgi:hypothetical protein|nr:DUF1080 domain-containing protein [Tepidisphaeraceae bacterium]
MDAKTLHAHTDTPAFPGTDWQVHGAQRPIPPVVTPGDASTQDSVGRAPGDAIVLFDGSEQSLRANWRSMKDDGGGPVPWTLADGVLEVVPHAGNIGTQRSFGDGQYHIEWTAPTIVKGQSQGRGNSGVFLLGKYEVQVLDCYDNPTYADGVAGGVYGQIPPLANVMRPPTQWNTYDIAWNGPVFDGDRLVRPARLTLLFNGVYVHHAVELLGQTGFRNLPAYKPHAPTGPLVLQDHQDLVRYRSVWYRPLGRYDAGRPESPVRSAL